MAAAPSNFRYLEITIISADNLKNVNWRNGDLRPYVTVYLDPKNSASTRPDTIGATQPVWNETLALPITSVNKSTLTLKILHSNPSQNVKPLVGTIEVPLSAVITTTETTQIIILNRPSGRPQGKVRFTLAIRSRVNNPPAPRPPCPFQYYHPAPYHDQYGNYFVPYYVYPVEPAQPANYWENYHDAPNGDNQPQPGHNSNINVDDESDDDLSDDGDGDGSVPVGDDEVAQT